MNIEILQHSAHNVYDDVFKSATVRLMRFVWCGLVCSRVRKRIKLVVKYTNEILECMKMKHISIMNSITVSSSTEINE